MKLVVDLSNNEMTILDDEAGSRSVPVYSTEGFEILSDLWVKVGWNQRYPYTFSWMGRPIIQLPEDMVRLQEVIWRLKPGVLIETGIAHGGSLIYYASLFEAMKQGRVVGIDIEIRAHNRSAIEKHLLAHRISMIEGSSIDPAIVAAARAHVKPGETVLVLLDSNHSYQHVLAELRAYSGLVTVGSYIVATDGLMGRLHDAPRGTPAWATDNPERAARDFAAENPDFRLEDPAPEWLFNESQLRRTPTHWPGAWLRRIAPA
jgi:cephalosporin hydroxylase